MTTDTVKFDASDLFFTSNHLNELASDLESEFLPSILGSNIPGEH